MKLDVNGKNYNVGGMGQTNLNTILGSIGTAGALGMLGGNSCGCGCGNNGILGNLFGGNNNNCCGCPVSEKELCYASALATCQANRYSDQVARAESEKVFLESRRVDEKINQVVKDTTEGLIKTGVAVAENAKALECLKIEVARNRDEARDFTINEVRQEAQLRKAADENLASWVDKSLCKKIEGKLVIPSDEICYGSCKPLLCNTNCLGTECNPVSVSQTKAAKAQ